MEDGRSRRGVATVDDGAAGYWEREARAQGIVIIADAGLTCPDVVAVPGLDPVILLGSWRSGPSREEAVAWGLCEIYRRALGACHSRRQIGRAVGQLVAAGDVSDAAK